MKSSHNVQDVNRYLESAHKRLMDFSSGMSWLAKHVLNSESYLELLKKLVLASHDSEFQGIQLNGPEKPFIHIVAIGKSGNVGSLFSSMLASVGIVARFLHPVEAFHGDLGVVRRGDVAILISQSGQSHELLQLVPYLLHRKCQLFAITANPNSPLARSSQFVLPLPPFPEMCPLGQSPISSTLFTLALCQSLVASTMEYRNLSVESYAMNHPGGAIGRRIFLKVSDVMIPLKKLPITDKNASFSDALLLMTEASLGALLVSENGRLVGLVGEKDLRVAMKNKGPQAFDLKVKDFMNPNPKTIEKNQLAKTALDTMENQGRPLNMLPVVDGHQTLCGLIRLHELVQFGLS